MDALRKEIFRFFHHVDPSLLCDHFRWHAWAAIQAGAHVPEKARFGEPGTAAVVATQAFGLTLAGS